MTPPLLKQIKEVIVEFVSIFDKEMNKCEQGSN